MLIVAKHPFSKWLQCDQSAVGRHSLRVLTERDGSRASISDNLCELVRGHYVDPKLTAKRIASRGAPKTAALLREHVPTRKKARSGDLGEVLATELAEQQLQYHVPIRRLQWKDGREMALRGDDIIGVARNNKDKLLLLKGESKSRATLSTAVLDEAGGALDSDRGRPTRHVRFTISKAVRWETNPAACHIDWVVCDSDWEAEFCRVVESHPQVSRATTIPHPRPYVQGPSYSPGRANSIPHLLRMSSVVYCVEKSQQSARQYR